MLPLDDQRWKELEGGYRVPCDISVTLHALESAKELEHVWHELWEELHHQGDVGVASYAAVPHIVRIARARQLADWNVFGLVGLIEASRLEPHNPPLPDWLRESYSSAWNDLFAFAVEQLPNATDETTVRQIFGVIALTKGLRKLGRLIAEFSADELDALCSELFATPST